MATPFTANYVAAFDRRNISVNYYIEIDGITNVFSKKSVSGKVTKNRLRVARWNPQKVRIDTARTTVGTIAITFIDPDVDLVTPDAMLVLGETLLAGAHLLRSLASQDAFQQKRVAVGGARLDEGKRFTNLLEFSAQTEVQAWKTLEPFLKDRPSKRIAVVTDTVPVLGGQ